MRNSFKITIYLFIFVLLFALFFKPLIGYGESRKSSVLGRVIDYGNEYDSRDTVSSIISVSSFIILFVSVLVIFYGIGEVMRKKALKEEVDQIIANSKSSL